MNTSIDNSEYFENSEKKFKKNIEYILSQTQQEQVTDLKDKRVRQNKQCYMESSKANN